jgi:hypothetical protein
VIFAWLFRLEERVGSSLIDGYRGDLQLANRLAVEEVALVVWHCYSANDLILIVINFHRKCDSPINFRRIGKRDFGNEQGLRVNENIELSDTRGLSVRCISKLRNASYSDVIDGLCIDGFLADIVRGKIAPRDFIREQ